MKRLSLIFLLSSFAFCQGVILPPQQALKVVNGVMSPVSNATITVCAANASGIPCTPVLVGAIFKDAALTQPLTNPFTSDANGNYLFAVAPGNYTVTVTGLGFSGYSYQTTAPVAVGSTNTFSQANTFTGVTNLNGGGSLTGTFTGPATFTSNNNFASVNNVKYADQFCPTSGPNAACAQDIGVAVNAAIAALPSATFGSNITPTGIVSLEGFRGIVNQTTQILINNNTVSLRGPGRSQLVISCSYVTALDDTAGCIRVKNLGFGGNYNDGPTLSGFTMQAATRITNNQVGLHLGDEYRMRLLDIQVNSFAGTNGIGIWMDNRVTGGYTEMVNFSDVATSDSNTCLRYSLNGGSISFGYGKYQNVIIQPSSGQTGLTIDATVLLYHSSLSINFEDQTAPITASITSVTCGASTCTLTAANTFPASAVGQYITQSGLTGASFLNGMTQITAVTASNYTISSTHGAYGPTGDAGTATLNSTWISLAAGASVPLGGNLMDDFFDITTEGQGAIGGPYVVMGNFSLITGQGHLNAWVGGGRSNGCVSGSCTIFGNGAVIRIIGEASVLGAQTSIPFTTLSAGWGTTATNSAFFGQQNNFQITTTSSGTGQAANPTWTVNFGTNAWRYPPIYLCKMVGGTGTLTTISGESTATTGSMVLTFNGTPVAGSTYTINCQGVM